MAGQTLKISDIARLAGVSPSAVSAAINHRPQISAATRERVLEVVRRHNYVPQSAARSLSGRRTYQIGVLVSSKVTLGLANSYFAMLMAGVNQSCQKHGFLMVVSTYDLSNISQFIMPPHIRQKSIDGLIMAGITAPEVVDAISETGIPFIVFGGNYSDDVLCIKRDMQLTAEKVARYLSRLGHKRICVPYFYQETFDIYNSLNEKDLDTELILKYFPGDDEFSDGGMLARSWLSTREDERFTAVISNDQFATGFLGEIFRNGKSCPEDISIVSNGDTALARYGVIPLTSFDEQVFQIGAQCAGLLCSMLNKEKSREDIRREIAAAYLDCNLIIRNSTGPAPKIAPAYSPCLTA